MKLSGFGTLDGLGAWYWKQGSSINRPARRHGLNAPRFEAKNPLPHLQQSQLQDDHNQRPHPRLERQQQPDQATASTSFCNDGVYQIRLFTPAVQPGQVLEVADSVRTTS